MPLLVRSLGEKLREVERECEALRARVAELETRLGCATRFMWTHKGTEDIVTRLTHERDEFLQNRCDHSFSKWSQAISECGTLRARVAEQDVREKRAEEYAIKLFRERDSWQKRAEEAEQEVERLKIWMRDE